MRLPLLKKRRRWVVFAVTLSLLACLLLISGIFRWSPLNCWHEDIDIKSGRVRHTRFLLYCKMSDRIEETWLSRALNSPHSSPDWRRVNTFSPGIRHSPHYHFHGAIHQIEMLEAADSTIQFQPEARRKVAVALLAAWQNTGLYSDADKYVYRVTDAAFVLHGNGAPVFTSSYQVHRQADERLRHEA